MNCRGGENIIEIYYMRKNVFSVKEKNKCLSIK